MLGHLGDPKSIGPAMALALPLVVPWLSLRELDPAGWLEPIAWVALVPLLAAREAQVAIAAGGPLAVGAEPADEAAADTWPMFRGVLAGTGRSAARITCSRSGSTWARNSGARCRMM